MRLADTEVRSGEVGIGEDGEAGDEDMPPLYPAQGTEEATAVGLELCTGPGWAVRAELQADGQIPSVGLLADAEAGEDPIEH